MSDWFSNPAYLPVGQPLTPISGTETLGADVPKSSSSDVSIAPATANYTNVTNVTQAVTENRYITYNVQPVQVFSPSLVRLDDARKAGEIAESASYFSQVRAGNLSITSDAWGGVSLAEANRMPLTSARLLLDADMTASSNNQLFNALTYAYIANASAYTSMVYRNSMSLIAVAQAAAVSAYTAQYNEIVREDVAAGNNDAITLVHNEYFSQDGAAGTIANLYFTLNEGEWQSSSAEVATNVYALYQEDLTTYVTAGRITNLWGAYIPGGRNVFGATTDIGIASSRTGLLRFYGSGAAHATAFQAGTATAAVTYTLPTAGPSVNGAALTSTTAGVMSWGATAAPSSAEAYVTIGNTSGLSAERALTGTSNQIVVTDNGANSTVVLSTPQNIHTTATPAFQGMTITGAATGSPLVVTQTPSTAVGMVGFNQTINGGFTTGTPIALDVTTTVNNATAHFTGSPYAAVGRITVSATNTKNVTGLNAVTALYESVASATGTMTTVSLFSAQPSGAKAGSETITTFVGLDIADLTFGSTNISIRSLGGQMRHVGNVKIGANSAPSYAVDVTGDVSVNAAFTTGYRVGSSLGGIYVPRTTDSSAFDYTVGSFTTDATNRTLDISAIVPSGAKAVYLRVVINDNAVSSAIRFFNNGNSNLINAFTVRTQVTGVTTDGYGIVPLDTNRVIAYNGDNVTFVTLSVYIMGWFM